MRKPTVHLNGTSRDSLIEQLSNAAQAIEAAIAAVCNAAPHPRDYYIQDGTPVLDIQAEHYDRVHRLLGVKTEIEEMLAHVLEQEPR
jgi:hypothetical protein